MQKKQAILTLTKLKVVKNPMSMAQGKLRWMTMMTMEVMGVSWRKI